MPLDTETLLKKIEATYAEVKDYQVEIEDRTYNRDGSFQIKQFLYTFKEPEWIRLDFETPYSGMVLVYSTLFMESLNKIHTLTMESPEIFEPRMKKICAAGGVAVIFIPELPGTRVYGATRWLNPNKALIQLSLRGKTDDHLWFTFFHEAGHILLHGKRDVFIEAKDEKHRETTRPNKEMEADRFAQDFLIPPGEYLSFMQGQQFSLTAIRQFAKRIETAPGVVVGRLQHGNVIPFSRGNYLKRRFRFSEN
jgi:hypothetical protein